MDHKSFTNPSGRLLKNKENNMTFFPNLLPPEIEYESLVPILSEAKFQLGRLDGIGTLIPNPHLLIRPYILREAVLSSKIEGTQASMVDIFHYQIGNKNRDSKGKRTVEVINYVKALDDCLEKINNGDEINVQLIIDAHKQLMDNVRGQELEPGKIRTIQNWIGPEGTKIEDAKYVPPPADRVLSLLNNLESFLQNPPQTMPSLIQCAIMHYQFEAIHPFGDGNGRIGRLLIPLLLASRGLLKQPLLYLSAFIENNKSEYYHLLLDVSKTSSWNNWIRYFLLGVITQTKDAINNIQKLMDLREKYEKRLFDKNASTSSIRLNDYLFANPVLTVPTAAKHLNITYPPAKKAIMKLVDFGILQKQHKQERNKTFVAHEIIEILS